ncbi:unnamed protein product [Soboliphyme baturini]|uniref:LHFPL tetraspan subfamily member 2b n=1 Tax=Soboliphyme baturini TaxID=241478 RepID=A0A183IBE6_9BILA|nr:unnamed protein product [Soboliphyme baturini]
MAGLLQGTLPLASVIALILSWIGVALFGLKMYEGIEAMEKVSSELFTFLLPWLRKVRMILVCLSALMIFCTLAMCVCGYFATRHLEYSYHGRSSPCLCSKIGSRAMCGTFWVISYLLNITWLGILCVVVVLISTYVVFANICLPQSGTESQMCFNFSIVSLFLANGNPKGAVSLILCGMPISHFCQLTRVFSPWYWSAFVGCFAVLLGLSHFNGSLAANFAHIKHAHRYRKFNICPDDEPCEGSPPDSRSRKLILVENDSPFPLAGLKPANGHKFL